ncbi:MAG: hypothetical protein HZB39_15930 [Planctomycetes bacterium]|nr:hypothetical protein [Planctomycetota bacterium]
MKRSIALVLCVVIPVLGLACTRPTGHLQRRLETVCALRSDLTELGDACDDDEGERLLAALAILDTLVQLDAELPAAEIGPWFCGFGRTAALLLLARSPDGDPALLDIVRTEKPGGEDLLWLSAGQMLAVRRSPGLATTALQRLAPVPSVDVVDRPSSGISKGGFTSIACGGPRVPAGSPALGVWVLRTEERAGACLVVCGPTEVWAERCMVDEKSHWPCGAGRLGDVAVQQACAAWLRELAGAAGDEPGSRRGVCVEWRSPEDFVAAVERARDAFAAEWGGLIASLDAEAAANPAPAIAIGLRDHRRDRSTPLPASFDHMLRR